MSEKREGRKKLKDLTDEEKKELFSPLAETVDEMKRSFSFVNEIKDTFVGVQGVMKLPTISIDCGVGSSWVELGRALSLHKNYSFSSGYSVGENRAFIDGLIARQSKKFWDEVTPVMEIWEIVFMFFPPPYGYEDRKAFAKSLIHAVERLKMPIDGSFQYCRKRPYKQKIRAPIDVDVFFEYVRSGYVDGVLESEAWRWVECAKLKYGGLVRSSRVIENDEVIKVTVKKEGESNSDVTNQRRYDLACEVWNKWNDLPEYSRGQKRTKTKVYEVVAEKEGVTRPAIHESINERFVVFISG